MADPRFFDRSKPISLNDLCVLCGASLSNDADPAQMIEDVASLDTANFNTISFIDNAKYKESFKITKAGACILDPKLKDIAPDGMALLFSDNPYKSYALVAQYFYPMGNNKANKGTISKQAFIDEKAEIDSTASIAAGAVIEQGVKIGANTIIEPNVTIGRNVVIGGHCKVGANASLSHAIIGNNVLIYPGARIGQDGFGFAIDPSGHVKVPQLGRVIIGDHVEIGANTTIDRGAGPDTEIGAGTFIDNLVQIAHNVKIGKGCVIVSQAGIAGSTVLEDYVVVAAKGGIAGHLTIGQGARIGAMAGVMRNVPAGQDVLGAPAIPSRDYMKQIAALKRLTQDRKNG